MSAYAEPVVPALDDTFVRARAGDREAFTELVERHHQELVRVAYAVTGELESARDSAQTAWVKAWQRLPSLREPERLRAWLIAIAANEARQNVRAGSRRRVREATPAMAPGVVTTDDHTLATERLDLAAALERLEPADRQLLAMRYLAGLSAEEIAVASGRSASGIRTRLSRLVRRLREELER